MKQITIYDLLPLLKKGWVAMDDDGTWCWFSEEPYKVTKSWWPEEDTTYFILAKVFNIAPFDGDWKDSLIKVEHKEEDSLIMVDKPTGPEWYKNGKRIK